MIDYKKQKIEIFTHDDDGYQIIYKNGVFFNAIHFNDDLLGESALMILEGLGHDVRWLSHDDIPADYLRELKERELLDDCDD